MGFPQRKTNNYPSLCFCHEEFTYKGYYCPKCNSKQCELPTDCTVCGLALISSPHLVRSYHHVFPVPEFKEIEVDDGNDKDEDDDIAIQNLYIRENEKDLQICFGCQA